MPKIKQKPVTNALFSLASNTIHPTKPLKPILTLFNCDHAEHKITGARKYLGLEPTIVFHFENFTMNMAGDLAFHSLNETQHQPWVPRVPKLK